MSIVPPRFAESANKKTPDELRASESRYRRLFETAKDGILILDFGSGEITDVNPFVVEMLGYTHSELVGKKLWEIGPFKDIPACRSAFTELQTHGYIRYEDLPLETVCPPGCRLLPNSRPMAISATKIYPLKPSTGAASTWNLSATSTRRITFRWCSATSATSPSEPAPPPP